MKKKTLFRISITLVSIAIFILLAIYVSYGYVNARIYSDEISKKSSYINQSLKIEYSDGTEVLTSKNTSFIPGAVIEKTFTLKNKGTRKLVFSISLNDVINTFIRKDDIIYELTSDGELLNNGMYKTKGVFPSSNMSILNKEILEVNETKTYKLKISYLNSEDNQIIDSGRAISAKLTFEENLINITKLNIFGNSIQDGVPTVDTPVEIMSLGKKTANLYDISRDTLTNGKGIVEHKKLENGYHIKIVSLHDTNEGSAYGYNYEIPINDDNKGKTYSLSAEFEKTGGVMATILVDVQKGNTYVDRLKQIDNSGTFTIPTDLDVDKLLIRSVLIIKEGQVGDYAIIKNIMLTETDTPMSYEPYNKYKVPVEFSGKNLFDFENKKLYWMKDVNIEEITNGVKLTSTYDGANNYMSYVSYELESEKLLGKTVTVSANFNLSENNISVFRIGYWVGDPMGFRTYKEVEISENGKHSFTVELPKKLPEGAHHLTLFINTTRVGNSLGAWVEVKNIQIEVNDEATKYEPYREPSIYNLYLDEPLRKVGDCENCSDYINFETGELVRNIKQLTFDGNEDIVAYDALKDGEDYGFFIKDVLDSSYNKNYAISSHFQNVNSDEGETLWIGNNDSSVYWINTNMYDTDLADLGITNFKSYLAQNPLTIQYVMNTPEITKIDLPQSIKKTYENDILQVCSDYVCASNVEVEFDN